MSLRGLTRALLLALACGAAHAQPAAADAPRVLRYAFPVAETGFDPAQISDLYSRTVIAGIIEAPLVFDFLARPFKMKPNTLVAMVA